MDFEKEAKTNKIYEVSIMSGKEKLKKALLFSLLLLTVVVNLRKETWMFFKRIRRLVCITFLICWIRED